MTRTATAFLLVGLLTGLGACAGGSTSATPRAVPPKVAAAPSRGHGLPEPIALPGPAGCTLRAARSSAGVTLELAAGVPYARLAQAQSVEVRLPIGQESPVAGVSAAAGNVRL